MKKLVSSVLSVSLMGVPVVAGAFAFPTGASNVNLGRNEYYDVMQQATCPTYYDETSKVEPTCPTYYDETSEAEPTGPPPSYEEAIRQQGVYPQYTYETFTPKSADISDMAFLDAMDEYQYGKKSTTGTSVPEGKMDPSTKAFLDDMYYYQYRELPEEPKTSEDKTSQEEISTTNQNVEESERAQEKLNNNKNIEDHNKANADIKFNNKKENRLNEISNKIANGLKTCGRIAWACISLAIAGVITYGAFNLMSLIV